MKKNLKIFIIIFTVFITCFNIGFPILSYSADINLDKDFEEANKTWVDVGGELIDGIVGILTWIPRAIIAAVSQALNTVQTQLCGFGSAGFTLTAEDIIFTGASSRTQQVDLLNINFFDFNANGANKSVIKSFREGVATWYFALRNMAIVVSLAVLIYIGIRMAISSIASEKARYKKMLTDWSVGFAVLFFLHYIILLVIIINNQLVDLIFSFSTTESTVMGNYSTELFKNIFHVSFVQGWGSLIVYFMLFGTTLALFVMYIKRLFTLGFLIVISPLITVTYSIDKLGDGKSQALNTWLKEFCYNVLIQPFHCIIYMIFVSAAMGALDASPSLANLVFAILAILFIFKAEGIVKKIFGFEATSMVEMAAAGALVGNAVSKINSIRQGKDTNTSTTSTKTTIQRKPIPGNVNTNTNTQQKQGSEEKSATTTGGNGGSTTTSTNANGGSTQTSTNANEGTTSGATEKAEATSDSTSRTTKNKKHKSAFTRAMSDYIGDKKDNFREFKADPKGSLKIMGKQLGEKELAVTAKYMRKLAAGAIVAGATGNGFSGIVTGYSTPPGRFTRKIQDYANEDLGELALEKQEKNLATAYNNYKLANAELSEEELYNKCADLLEVPDIDRLKDSTERNLARQLQKIETRLIESGLDENVADVKVMDAVEDIQLGNIKNSVSVSLDSVSSAASKFRAEKSSLGKEQIMNLSREFIDDIDSYKQRGDNFKNSEKYKALGKAEKELAKEIYKSKSVLEAIGDNSIEVINQEIQKSIEKGIE